MQLHDRHVVQVGCERLADAGNPRAIDEPEIVERIRPQPVDQIGGRNRQSRRIRPERAEGRRHCDDSDAHDGEHDSEREPT